MTIDTAALRALAQRATPGPWMAWNGADTQWIVEAAKQYVVNTLGGNDEPNAQYIAACSPSVLLALLDEIDAARGAGR